jgi:multicomponent Na+:H+ antiporter subunit E
VTRLHVLLFSLLLTFWYVLSDQYSPLFHAMAVASALLVTAVFTPIVATSLGTSHQPLSTIPKRLLAIAVYLVWLVRSIVLGGLQVAWIVVNPRVHPEPRMLRFRTNLESRFARVLVANTISVVPGTLTVRLDGDEYWVHALIPDAAADLIDGTLQSRIAAMFLEEPERAIDPRWETPPEVRT